MLPGPGDEISSAIGALPGRRADFADAAGRRRRRWRIEGSQRWSEKRSRKCQSKKEEELPGRKLDDHITCRAHSHQAHRITEGGTGRGAGMQLRRVATRHR